MFSSAQDLQEASVLLSPELMRALRASQPIEPDEEVAIVAHIKAATASKEERDRLVRAYLPLLYRLAREGIVWYSWCPFAELFSAAVSGFLFSFRTYRRERGTVAFWGAWYGKEAMRSYAFETFSLITLPVSQTRRKHRHGKTLAELFPVIYSLHDTIPGTEYGTFEEIISVEQEERVTDAITVSELLPVLWRAIYRLPSRDREIFVSRRLLGTPPTHQELADRFGVSRARVQQIETRAFRFVQQIVREFVPTSPFSGLVPA
jgi:RNA polymerase sigma factor (sigma-70 family)